MKTLEEIRAEWAKLKRAKEIAKIDDEEFTEQHAKLVGEAYRIEDYAVKLSRKILDEGYLFFKWMQEENLEQERSKR